ncbi:MAG: MMPL family transporter [Methylobacteriaceae bacterium]|nr:MMPL family transporter [Methylobacteriaceae bacterium]
MTVESTIAGAPCSSPAPSTSGAGSRLAGALVAASIRAPWFVVGLFVLLALIGGYVTATRFAITTETDQLIQSNSAWLKDKRAYQQAFPQLAKVVLAVVDGATPEIAEAAAAKLTEALSREPGPAIRRAWRPDGGPFFARNGLLLMPGPELDATLKELVQQGPTLTALATDPSLRGVVRLIALGAEQDALGDSAPTVNKLAAAIDHVLAGRPAHFSWRSLLSGGAPDPQELRKFVLVDPVLDYDALQPAKRATDRIRQAAAAAGLTPENGVTVRLTGAPPLADEEFATVGEGAPLHLGLTVVAIAVILYLALRSGRVIFAVLVTTLVGLVITVGAGLLMVGRYNVISVAVAALFLGLGVDFGIQYAVRYRDERHKLDELRGAIRRAGFGIGWSLTLAAASLLAGFFSFLPTSFKGVSELGLITGVGMIIAYLAALTLLPALIALLDPPGEPDTVETPALAAVDRWIYRNRKAVVWISVAVTLAGLPFLARLEFDANPMHLRSDKTEAVATFLDLTRQPGFTPNTISVLVPSLAAAEALGAKLARLPEVARVATLRTFWPDDQDAKIARIAEARGQLTSLFDERPPVPPPSDQDLVATLRDTAAALREKAGAGEGAAAQAMGRLAGALGRLADGTPAQRQKAEAEIAGGLPGLIQGVRALLSPERIARDSIPSTIADDWVTPDGRARVEVVPKGDANDNVVLDRFTAAVQGVAPNAFGGPVDVVESRGIIVRAFVTAGLLALGAVFVLLTIALRRPKDVALTLGPLVLATVLTLEAAYLIGMPLNLANIIALPLMLAVGVNFHIYYMILWREGVVDMLASSLTRAIFFSSLTTGVAFGSLWLSHHPGTASMGKLLTLSLVFTLAAAFIVVPAFLGPPEEGRHAGG